MFSIDLHHRRAEDFAPFLDFALITHNHGDHYTERFKEAMDRVQRKPEVNNLFSNYGVKDRSLGGYTRAKRKVLQYGDVKVVTGLCDHNSHLIDNTTTFEIHIGGFALSIPAIVAVMPSSILSVSLTYGCSIRFAE